MKNKCCDPVFFRIVCECDENGNFRQMYECPICHTRYREERMNIDDKEKLKRFDVLAKFLKEHPNYVLMRYNNVAEEKNQNVVNHIFGILYQSVILMTPIHKCRKSIYFYTLPFKCRDIIIKLILFFT